jgi:hypothetical protein
MAGTSPAMTKSESISISWKKPENADCFFGQALRSGSWPRVSNLEAVGCNDADLTQTETFPTAQKNRTRRSCFSSSDGARLQSSRRLSVVIVVMMVVMVVAARRYDDAGNDPAIGMVMMVVVVVVLHHLDISVR